MALTPQEKAELREYIAFKLSQGRGYPDLANEVGAQTDDQIRALLSIFKKNEEIDEQVRNLLNSKEPL